MSFFKEYGYVVFTKFATQSSTQMLRDQGELIMKSFLESSSKASVFTTDEENRKIDDDYFLSSASKISCFLEENDGSSPQVNKIGHALHELDDVFRDFSFSEDVKKVADIMGYGGSAMVQSMYIVKGARIGGEVNDHRDATFVRGEDNECLGFWWALEKADKQNGCLWISRGSQNDEGRAKKRFMKKDGKLIVEGKEIEDNGDWIAVEVENGDLVLIDGEVRHKSDKNTSGRSRHAYSVHLVRGDIADDCWLRRQGAWQYTRV